MILAPPKQGRCLVRSVRSRWTLKFLLVVALLWCVTNLALFAATTRIIKVLPQFVDQKGRVALNPSLYERDAYQAHLRTHPNERSGLRFAIQWKSKDLAQVKVRLELRGNRGSNGTTVVLDDTIKQRGLLSTWSVVSLTGESYRQFGELSAWRATLWDGDKLLAEQSSFLW